MRVIEIELDQLRDAPLNPNVMNEAIEKYLDESLDRYGLVRPIVVRFCEDGSCEIIAGHHTAKAMRKRGDTVAPCVVLKLSDADARLLGQALNHIHGEDDLGLRAELLREVLESVDEDFVTSLLPETSESLAALASLGQEDMASNLQAWQAAQAARLKHLQLQLTASQSEIVEQAIQIMLPRARDLDEYSPNVRGKAVYLLCKDFLEREEGLE